MGGAEELDHEHVRFFIRIGPGTMLDSPGHQDDLAFLDLDGFVLETHLHFALHDVEQFIAVVMGMLDEFPLDFRKEHLKIMPLRNQMRMPLLGEEGELLG
jgi:hypothetical protein